MNNLRRTIHVSLFGLCLTTIVGCGSAEFENMSPRASAEDVEMVQQEHAALSNQRAQQEAAYFANRR